LSKKTAKSAHGVWGILPGVLLCLAVMFIGLIGAELIGLGMQSVGMLQEGSETPVSGIFVAIILGLIIRNTLPVSDVFTQGIQFSMKYLLQIGIILLGLRLSLMEALKLGAIGIPLIVVCISIGLLVTLYLTKKLNQSMRLGTLIASGTGICGVTAIMATAPVIKAKEDEISYAVANITIFGLASMMLYPFLANLIFANDPVKAGLFLGTAIHDTAQVTGAALIYDQLFQNPTVIDVATVTKLTRNLFLIAIIPFVSYLFFNQAKKNNKEKQAEKQVLPKWYTFIPGFVVGFLVFSLVRTIGDASLVQSGSAFGLFNGDLWESMYSNSSSFGTTYLLGAAMAGVGLSTNFKMFKGIGIKPFYIGLTAALSVGIVSVLFVSLLGEFVVI